MSDPSATPRVETDRNLIRSWIDCQPEMVSRETAFSIALDAYAAAMHASADDVAAAVREERERLAKLIPEVLGHLGEMMHRDLEYLIAAESLLAALNEETDHAL